MYINVDRCVIAFKVCHTCPCFDESDGEKLEKKRSVVKGELDGHDGPYRSTGS